MTSYCLITGASKGIGKAMAFEAAKRGMNLLLVARSKDLLENISKELSAKGATVKTLAVDLFEPDAADKIFKYISENSLSLNMLINNAGMGFYGNFDECDLNKHLEVMKLNMDIHVKITYQFLKTSDTKHRRYILNTVSAGAFQPVPAMTIYSATKAFMLFFSRGLRHELATKNVYVTALCPGGVESEFFGPAQMTAIAEKNAKFMTTPEKVAVAGLNAVMKNKSVVIPGFTNKLGALASKLISHDIVVPVTAKFFKP